MQRREFLQSSGYSLVIPSMSGNDTDVTDQNLPSEKLPKTSKQVIKLQTSTPDEITLSRPDYSQIPPLQAGDEMFLSNTNIILEESDYLVVDDGITFHLESGRSQLVPSIVSSAILYDGRAASDVIDCETECDEYPVYDNQSKTIHYKDQILEFDEEKRVTLTGTFLVGDPIQERKRAIPIDIKVMDIGETDIYYHEDAIIVPQQAIDLNFAESFTDETERTAGVEPQSQTHYSNIRRASNAKAIILDG